MPRQLSRSELLASLRSFGITGAQVYLIDAIPLLEMLWADGRVQGQEAQLVEAFMRDHIDSMNRLAGYSLLSREDGAAFLDRFLRERPAPDLLEQLRAMVAPVRFSSSDVERNEESRRALVEWCLDIAAANVSEYPYDARERFCQEEKACLQRIMAALYPI